MVIPLTAARLHLGSEACTLGKLSSAILLSIPMGNRQFGKFIVLIMFLITGWQTMAC